MDTYSSVKYTFRAKPPYEPAVRPRLLLLVILAALAIAGCGGSKPNATQQVHSVVNQFTVEMGQGQIKAGCTLTTGQLGSKCSALSQGPSATECQGAGNSELGQACAMDQQIKSTLSTFTSLTISKVVVIGKTATVAFSGSDEVMTLADHGGHWLISSA